MTTLSTKLWLFSRISTGLGRELFTAWNPCTNWWSCKHWSKPKYRHLCRLHFELIKTPISSIFSRADIATKSSHSSSSRWIDITAVFLIGSFIIKTDWIHNIILYFIIIEFFKFIICQVSIDHYFMIIHAHYLVHEYSHKIQSNCCFCLTFFT